MTPPRLGQLVPGVGTVVGPGPASGTWWAVPDGPGVAGVVVDRHGRPGEQLTRAEQATRIAHADAVLARGVVLAGHELEARDMFGTPRLAYRVHLQGCADTGRPQDEGTVFRIQRVDVARAALAGATVHVGVAGDVPAEWCDRCLGGDGTR